MLSLMKRTTYGRKMKKIICSVLIAFVYSVAYTIFGPMAKTQNFIFNPSMIISLIGCFALCLLFLTGLYFAQKKIDFSFEGGRLSRVFHAIGDKKMFLIVWAFIFVSWVPAFLNMFPGVLSYDSMSQVSSAIGIIDNNHHPILHTWLLRVFMNLGACFFEGYEAGIGIMNLFQMLILSYSLTRLVFLLYKNKVPCFWVIVTALCSAFWFTNACMAVTMVKDTLHAAFLVLFVCHFAEIVLHPEEYVSRKTNLVAFPVIVFFMCAFRNNGLHIYFFCVFILLVLRLRFIRSVRRYVPLLIAMVIPIIAFKIYTEPVFQMLNIQQGEVREALSIPIQQLQRVAVIKGDELTKEQNVMMEYYITDLSWRAWDPGRKYDPYISDPAKSCFISSHYEEDKPAFWKFYLKTGKQFTKEYLAAFLSNTLGYWYPGYYKYSYVMCENYPSESFVVPLERKSLWENRYVWGYYNSVCQLDVWRQIPFVRVLFVQGFAPWILLGTLIISWRGKGFLFKTFPLFLPLIAQYGIMILSPMSSFRYAWPFFLMLPLTLVGIFMEHGESKESSAETEQLLGEEV